MLTESISTADIQFDEQFSRAYDLLENGKSHTFVTGKAGTGKSTLLKYFCEHTSKNIVVLAPTGVAAVNVRGQTIHSFFRFRPDITPEAVGSIRIRKAARAIYKNIDTIVIDEISMVRADLLDCVDIFMRMHGKKENAPFGGAQMIFFGDLYQLPPVVTGADRGIFEGVYASPYFFDARSFKENEFQCVELRKIYRQKDEVFIQLLSGIRDKSATPEHLKMLNARFIPGFKPEGRDFYVYLTTTNAMADRINAERLAGLDGTAIELTGEVKGEFDRKALPTHTDLKLKPGAQVMLLNNEPNGRWVNGTIGKVVSDREGVATTGVILVELLDHSLVEVALFTWEMFAFRYDEERQCIDAESVGSFQQYPLKLAWAVTIHKSQGKTFPKVIVDVGNGTFAPGQMYVALSRCVSLEGLILRRPVHVRHILLDQRVVEFMRRFNRSKNLQYQ